MEDWFTNDRWETHQSIRKWENLPFLSYRIAPSLLLSRPISANSYSATNLYVYNNLRMLPHQKKKNFAFFFAVSLSKMGRLCQRKAALSYLVMELEHTESEFFWECVSFEFQQLENQKSAEVINMQLFCAFGSILNGLVKVRNVIA